MEKKARNLRPGDWIAFDRNPMRVVDVSPDRDSDIRVHADYGDASSEPATLWFEADEIVPVLGK